MRAGHRLVVPAALLAIAGAGLAARAHVAPSERDNNRYLLVAPLGDSVRLVYTIYMGQIPGRAARARMDADRNGQVDEEEARRFGDQLAAEVGPRLSVEVDGRATPITWQEVDVGLGEPWTGGGAFAVDMVTWLCLDGTGPGQKAELTHRIRLRDRFHIPDPGETELRAEESPGVRITRSEMGDTPPQAPRLGHSWRGGPGPLEQDGYLLEFSVDPAVAAFGAATCRPADGPAGRHWLSWVAVALAGAAALAAGLALARRRRTAPTDGDQNTNG